MTKKKKKNFNGRKLDAQNKLKKKKTGVKNQGCVRWCE